ncbi:uncharacterized protein [Anas acuta]|uniref:uncharacterized protein isoform X5 n=1 Tax=Anas acuta TaxID=28680 RepID=UPI0035C9243D
MVTGTLGGTGRTGFTLIGEQSFHQRRQVHTHEGEEEHYSKLTKGEGNPESLQRGDKKMSQSFQGLRMKFESSRHKETSLTVQDLGMDFEPSGGKKMSPSVQETRMNFVPSSVTLKGEQSFHQGRQMHSHEGEQEHYSKLTKGEGNPESLQRGDKKMSQSFQGLRMKFESSSTSSAAPQLAVPGRRTKTPHAGHKETSLTVQDLGMDFEPSGGKKMSPSVQETRMNFVPSSVTLKGEQSFHQGRQMHSHEGEQEHYSKLTKGEGNPESLQRGHKETSLTVQDLGMDFEPSGDKKMSQSFQGLRMKFESSSTSSAAPQLAVPGRRTKTPHAGHKETSLTVQDLGMDFEPSGGKKMSPSVQETRMNFVPSSVTLKGEQSFHQGRQMHSHEGEQEHYSKLTKGEGNPESLQRGHKETSLTVQDLGMDFEPSGDKKMSQSFQGLRMKFESSSTSSAAPQLAVPGRRTKTPHAGHKETSLTVQDLGMDFEPSGGKKMSPSVQETRMNFVPSSVTLKGEQSFHQGRQMHSHEGEQEHYSKLTKGEGNPESLQRGRNVEIDITRGQESSWQEMERIMDQKMAVLQNQLEVSQNAYREELISLESKLERTVDIKTTRALESTQQEAEKILSEKVAVLQNQLEVSQNAYREELISLESKLERTVDIKTTRALESTQQEAEKILSEKVAVLQNQLEVSQNAYREELISLESKLERTVDIKTTRALESTQQEAEKILSEKVAVLQNQLEVSQNAYREELISLESKLERTVDIKTTRALESTQQEAEKILSEKVAVLQNQLEVSQNAYREELISLESKLERTVDIKTTRALESTQQEAEKILSEKVAVLQNQLEVSQNAYREELISLESKLERTVDIKTTRALESTQQEAEKILSEKVAVLQNQLEVSQNAYREELISLESKLERTVDIKTTRALESTQQEAEKILSEKVAVLQNQLEVSQNAYREELISLESKLERTVDIKTTRALESTQQEAEKILSEKVAVLQNQLEVSQNAYREELISLESKLERTVDIKTTRALESTQQEAEKILSEKVAVLQNQLEVSQNAYREELISLESKLERTVDIKTTRALESTQQEAEKILSEKVAVLQNQLEVSQNAYREELISLESKLERTVDIKTTRALESTQQEAEKILSEKVAVLQNQLEVSQNAYREELISLESKLEFFIIQIYKVDISLDADTAHPRLEVSEDGKSVKDTGMIRKVPMRQKRFDSHLFVLAKEGYTSGRFYWEVNVGKRRNWILGVAQESVTRKGTVTLSPNNGFWVIGLVDGQEYWAYMDPWTHLAVTGTLQKIGIFLDISTKQLSFYNVHKKTILHAFTIADDSMQEGKLIPIFSTGSASAKIDLEPLSLV